MSLKNGIIPACAGNTTAFLGYLHPKVGSSPRVRGTPRRHDRHWRGVGIIPACAGNTMSVIFSRTEVRDHPRVCGEHMHRRERKRGVPGSSPRVRGTPVSHHPDSGRHGIIPACAGNTVCDTVAQYDDGDHPRVCGEHILIRRDLGITLGSSPRVRGTHHA